MLRIDDGHICQHMKDYNNTSMDFHPQSSQNPSTATPISTSTPSISPLTPHTRHASLSESTTQPAHLAALRMIPHRSMMSIESLITPPNSGETKQLNSFDQVETPNNGAGAETDLLFPSPSTQSVDLQLFSPQLSQPIIPKNHTPAETTTQQLPAEQAKAVQDWSRRDGPHWENLNANGIRRPRGVHTWEQWRKYEAMDGNHLSKPTQEEYHLVAHFLNGMKSSDPSLWTRRISTTPSPQKKRKVLQDNSVKRRSLVDIAPSSRKRSSTPSVYGDSTNQSALERRRRASRVNSKAAGTETKSARAPSSKPPKDPDWWNYKDYAPDFAENAPADAMTCANNAHKFDNKDNKKGPRDLSADLNRNNLHAAELTVASWLHLDCHRYLTSKRQIFQGYVEHLKKKQAVNKRIKDGLEEPGQTKLTNWNKTEAQKLLGIDVSKGSYIWSFYKDLGWFEDEALPLYEQHLRE